MIHQGLLTIHQKPKVAKLGFCRKSQLSDIFFSPMDGSLVIMESSLLSIFLLFHWMVALSLWKVVCCRGFFLLQWMVALSLWKVVGCQDICDSNGW